MAKQLEFNDAARKSLQAGVDKLANAVKVTLGRAAQRCARQAVGCARHHQRRRVHCPRD